MTPTLVLLSALAFGSAPKPTRVDAAMTISYVPTVVGTRLVFRSTTVPEKTCDVTAVSKVASGRCVSLIISLPNLIAWASEKVVVSDAGVVVTAKMNGELNPADLQLRLPAKQGKAWCRTDGCRAVIVGEGSVTVPAGRFTAVRVDWERPTPVTYWYAPGLGIIRLDAGGEVRFALKSVTPPK